MRKLNYPAEDYFTIFSQQKSLMLHEKRIRDVQPTLRGLNNPRSHTSGHIKKQPLSSLNRLLDIQIENKALLKKLTNTNRSPFSQAKSHKLLSKNNRKKVYEDHERVVLNYGLQKRIKEAKSSYQCARFAEERKKTERFLQTRSKHSRGICSDTNHVLAKTKQNEKRNYVSTFEENIVAEDNVKNNEKIIEIIGLKLIKIKDKFGKNISAFLTGIIWEKTCALQINLKKQNKNDRQKFKLAISKEDFDLTYDGQIKKLIKRIYFDSENHELLLSPPEQRTN